MSREQRSRSSPALLLLGCALAARCADPARSSPLSQAHCISEWGFDFRTEVRRGSGSLPALALPSNSPPSCPGPPACLPCDHHHPLRLESECPGVRSNCVSRPCTPCGALPPLRYRHLYPPPHHPPPLLQYRHLYRVREALPDVPFMALTATATPKVCPPAGSLVGHAAWVQAKPASLPALPRADCAAALSAGRPPPLPCRALPVCQTCCSPIPGLLLLPPVAMCHRCGTILWPTCASSPMPASEPCLPAWGGAAAALMGLLCFASAAAAAAVSVWGSSSGDAAAESGSLLCAWSLGAPQVPYMCRRCWPRACFSL